MQTCVWNDCHDVTMLCLNLDIIVITIRMLVIVVFFITLANLTQFMC